MKLIEHNFLKLLTASQQQTKHNIAIKVTVKLLCECAEQAKLPWEQTLPGRVQILAPVHNPILSCCGLK